MRLRADAARVAVERDVAAFALWIGIEETRDTFRQALADLDEASHGR